MTLRVRLIGSLLAALAVASAQADERRFTYVYEPETPPAGALEFENWVTLGSQRNSAVGQDNFNQWDLRQEIEYGVTDRYSLSLYLNEQAQSYQDPATGQDISQFDFNGVSLENRFNVLNPADHAVGFTLYLEGRYSGDQAEIEEKLIFGQRHGEWKWAFNLEQATEWENNLSTLEAEFGASFGLARDLGKHWSIGIEFLNQSIVPGYDKIENTALFLGPVLSYRQEKWWAALTVLPQIKGWNFGGDPDGDSHYELVDHEKLNIRLLIGFNF